MTAPRPPIGQSRRRLDDPAFLRGAARFVGDLRLDGMVSVAFVRSPFGHARVERRSFERARAMPGVVAIFGPNDLLALAKPMAPQQDAAHLLARPPSPLTDEPRYAGEVVAAVVADTPCHAADAVEAVEVEFSELPVVVDPVAALADGAPLVHADVPNNRAAHIVLAFGDTDEAFRAAEVVVRDRFVTERVYHAAVEPRGVVAMPGGEGGAAVTVWASTQSSTGVRQTVAGALGLLEEQVRVIVPRVGGAFGAKGRSYPEEVAVAAIALHLNRPCRWEAPRAEDFASTYQGHGLTTEAELAARADGALLGLRAHLIQDAGAYASGSPRPPEHAAEHLVGPYRLPALDARIDAVYTNKVPLTPIRGGGREQGIFVIERLLDHLARQIGADPLDIRTRNLLPPEAFPYDTKLPRAHGGTVVYDSGDFPGHLAEARRLIGYDDFKAARADEPVGGVRRGVAVTLFIESTGVGPEGARVALQDDGSVLLAVGSPDTGQSHATVMRQICAAELGVPEERIAFVSGDTQAMAIGIGTFASRFAVMAGNATAQAARDARQQVLRAAADRLEAAEQDLEIAGGIIRVAGAPDRLVTFAEVARQARAADAPIEAVSVYSPEHGQTYAGGAFGAVVAVDVETGQVTVERFVAVHDCGKVINRMVVSGQVHGGVAMGIGEALAEAIVYDERGQLLTADFAGYVVPRATDIPEIAEKERPCLAGTNPEGIKGAGEGGLIGTLPVIAAAIEDALAPLDARLNHLPIQPEDLCRLCAPLRPGATFEDAG